MIRGLPVPPAGWLLGVDTSQAQGAIDAAAIRDAGCSFLFAKSSDGVNGVDEEWKAGRTQRACLDAGLDFGAYFVLEPYGCARADAQALHFAEVFRDCGATLPWALDFELATKLSGLEALQAALRALCVAEQATGRPGIVYTGPAFFELLERYAGHPGLAIVAELAKRPLWIADYRLRAPEVPPGWDDWTFHQASGGKKSSPTNFATLPVARIEVDVDYFRGTLAELIALGAPT